MANSSDANLFDTLRGLPDLCAAIFERAREFRVKLPQSISKLVICGVGDGALAGEMFQALTRASSALPIVICRERKLPAFAGQDSLIVFLSLSGTEPELVDAYSEASDVGASSFVITAGGHLRDMAQSQSLPCFLLPPDLSQAAELAALFFALWGVFAASSLSSVLMPATAIADAGSAFALLRRQYAAFGPEAAEQSNPSRQLAGALRNTMPLVYGPSAIALIAAKSWQSQFAHIALMPVYWSELPAFKLQQMPYESSIAAIVLRDSDDSRVVHRHLEDLKISLGRIPCHEITMDGHSDMERLWGAIYLADWAAFYLAP